LLILLIIIIVIARRRARQAEAEKPRTTPLVATSTHSNTIRDPSEVDPNDLVLHEVIGQGNFGIVHRGELVVCVAVLSCAVLCCAVLCCCCLIGCFDAVQNLTSRTEVAVKTLPQRSTDEVVTRFLGEIALMREFPPHVNVVK
jgi:hypothetical protein